MTIATGHRLTLEEYLDYDDGTDTRYELVDGELVETPAESRLNHKIASFLFGVFIRIGIVETLLAIGTQIVVTSRNATARQPDFVVLSQACADALEGAASDTITPEMPVPALVVEVVSPGHPGTENYDRDYIEKPAEYAVRGIPELWRIDPQREVMTVLTLNDGVYQAQDFRGGAAIGSLAFPELVLTAQQVLKAGMSVTLSK